jgi:hypothetical protein
MITKRTMKPINYALAAALLSLVAGCGGGGGGGGGGSGTGTTPPPPVGTNPPPATGQFTLGGTVSGLGSGAVVTLANGSETLPVNANGAFTFATKLDGAAAYNITATPPGGYTCKVTDGTGTMAGANSTKTTVACAPVLLAGAITALQEPQGVTGDGNGNLYIVDGGPHSVLKLSSTGVLTTLAGALAKPGYADGAGANARFRFYGGSDVLVDAQGNLFVSDECNGAIRKIAADGTVSTLAGQGSTFCNNVAPAAGAVTRVDGTGTAARFERPNRMVSDGAGGVILIDSIVPGAVRRVSASGVVTTQTFAAPTGLPAVPTFYALARSADGSLYLSDFDGRIWKEASGSLVLLAGGRFGVGSVDGNGSAARFSAITDLVAIGNDLYVGDFSMVRKVTAAGEVTTIAGSATRGFADGKGDVAKFTSVRAMGADGNSLIVIDNDQGVLRRVSLDGTVTTLAATPGLRGNADGTGSTARYNWHTSLAADTDGNLYSVDSANHIVRKTMPDGSVTRIAGIAGTPGNADGALATATFTAPRAIAAGKDGSLWIAQDTGLRRILNGTVSTVDAALRATNLTVDPDGNAIVTTLSNTVERITPAGAKTVLVDKAMIAGLIKVADIRFVPQSVVVRCRRQHLHLRYRYRGGVQAGEDGRADGVCRYPAEGSRRYRRSGRHGNARLLRGRVHDDRRQGQPLPQRPGRRAHDQPGRRGVDAELRLGQGIDRRCRLRQRQAVRHDALRAAAVLPAVSIGQQGRKEPPRGGSFFIWVSGTMARRRRPRLGVQMAAPARSWRVMAPRASTEIQPPRGASASSSQSGST